MRRLALLLLLALGACGGGQRPRAGADYPILRLVPEDTPYLVAMLRPSPREYLDKIASQWELVQKGAEPTIALLRASDEPGARLAAELMAEMVQTPRAGHAVRAVALYGVGLLPVLRVQITEPAAVRAAIVRAAGRAKLTLTPVGKKDRTLWRVPAGGIGVVLVGVIGDELIATFAPTGEVDAMVAAVTGERPPARSFGAQRIHALLGETGATEFGVGLIDSARVLASLADRIPLLGGAVCQGELTEIAKTMPRITLAIDELSGTRFGMRLVAELRPDLAAKLGPLRATAPGVGVPLGESVVSFGFAIDLPRLIQTVAGQARAVTASPYKCLALSPLNEAAEEVARGLSRGPEVLGPYRELIGAALVLSSAGAGDFTGYALVTATDPLQVFELAKGLLPGLSSIQLRADGAPVRVPSGTIALLPDAWLAVRGQTLGIAIGASMDRPLAAALSAPLAADRPVFSMSADMPRFAELMRMLGNYLGGEQLGSPSIYRRFDMRLTFEPRGVVLQARGDL